MRAWAAGPSWLMCARRQRGRLARMHQPSGCRGRGRCARPLVVPSSLSPPPETISHALLLCPAAAPAIAWMRAVWAAVAGVDVDLVPSDAGVLLADDLAGWPDAPASKSALRLWTRLRVATLGSIWQARCERDAGGLHPGVSLASRAASLALGSLLEAIRRDWSRIVGAAPAPLPSMCAAWLRGFDSSITLAAFKQQWASPEFFCCVHEVGGFPPALEVHLGGPGFPALPG